MKAIPSCSKWSGMATRLIILLVVVAIVVFPVLALLPLLDVFPERWRFDHWPLWLQIPFGMLCALYVIAEIWTVARSSRK